VNIIWSDTALSSYLSIIDYLYEQWTQREVINFQNRVNELLDNLTKTPFIGKPSQILPYRKYVLSKQTSLIYSVNNDTIILVTFLSNYTNHTF